ncbi:hypothetical protein KC341_g25 [Hortaea werneckii]|nr:hypothetical protein KC341_g25 [Hortaea werneckii]
MKLASVASDGVSGAKSSWLPISLPFVKSMCPKLKSEMAALGCVSYIMRICGGVCGVDVGIGWTASSASMKYGLSGLAVLSRCVWPVRLSHRRFDVSRQVMSDAPVYVLGLCGIVLSI